MATTKSQVTVYCKAGPLEDAKVKAVIEKTSLTAIFERAIELWLIDALPELVAVQADKESVKGKELTTDFLK